jgi:acyl carrier protein
VDSQRWDTITKKEIELWVKTRLAEIVGSTSEEINCEAIFTSLGLSLSDAVTFSVDLEEHAGIHLEPAFILEGLNIKTLVELITKQDGSKWSIGNRVQEGKQLELTYAQEQMWLLEQLTPNSPTNHITDLVFEIKGTLDIEILKECFQEIINRHESLRSTINMIGGVPRQVVHVRQELPFTLYDLESLDSEDKQTELRRITTQEARRPFNL